MAETCTNCGGAILTPMERLPGAMIKCKDPREFRVCLCRQESQTVKAEENSYGPLKGLTEIKTKCPSCLSPLKLFLEEDK